MCSYETARLRTVPLAPENGNGTRAGDVGLQSLGCIFASWCSCFCLNCKRSSTESKVLLSMNMKMCQSSVSPEPSFPGNPAADCVRMAPWLGCSACTRVLIWVQLATQNLPAEVPARKQDPWQEQTSRPPPLLLQGRASES